MMTDKIYTIDEIRKKVQPIAEKYKLNKVSLFGSYARGEATAESDIDLYIQASKYSYSEIPWAAGAMYSEFESAFGKPIDIVTVRSVRENWNMRSTRYLYQNIKNDEVVLYERRNVQRHKYIRTYSKVL